MIEWISALINWIDDWKEQRVITRVGNDLQRLEKLFNEQEDKTSFLKIIHYDLEKDKTQLVTLSQKPMCKVRSAARSKQILELMDKVTQFSSTLFQNELSNSFGLESEINKLEEHAEKLEESYAKLKLKNIEQHDMNSLMQLHDSVTSLINKSGKYRIKENQMHLMIARLVFQPKENVEILKGKLEKIQTALVGVQKGTQELELLLEKQIFERVRESKMALATLAVNATPEEQQKALLIKPRNSLKNGLEIIVKQHPKLGEEAKRLINFIFVSDNNKPKQHPFTYKNFQDIEKCKENLLEEMAKLTAGEAGTKPHELARALKPIIALLENCQKEIKNAFKDRYRTISSILRVTDLDKLKDEISLLAARLEAGKTGQSVNDEELQTLKVTSDLFWTFYTPISLRISIHDFIFMFEKIIEQNKTVEFLPDMSLESSLLLLSQLKKIEAIERNLKEIVTGASYSKLSQGVLSTMRAHKLKRLQSIRQSKREEMHKFKLKPLNIKIAGGGPGGLIRGLIAASAGANWELIEKRDRESNIGRNEARRNILSLDREDIYEMLSYFGVYEDLLIHKKVKPFYDRNWSVAIDSLEDAMTTSLKTFIGKDQGEITYGEVVALHSGQISMEKQSSSQWEIATQVIIKQKVEPSIHSYADIIVAADGANGATAKLLGIDRDMLSSESTMFIIRAESPHNVVLRKSKNHKVDKLLVQLDTPNSLYLMTSLLPSSRSELKKLQQKVANAQNADQKKAKQKELDAWLKKAAENFMKSQGFEGKVILCRPFNIVISKGSKAAVVQAETLGLASGDAYATPDPITGQGCKMALRSAGVFSSIVGTFQQNSNNRFRSEHLQQARTEYDYGMDQLYSSFVESSFRNRLLYTRSGESNTYLLRQAESAGILSSEIVSRLKVIFHKQKMGVPYTDEESEMLQEAQGKVKGIGKPEEWVTKLDTAMKEVQASMDARTKKHKIFPIASDQTTPQAMTAMAVAGIMNSVTG